MEEKTILVVDDEEVICDLLSKILTKLGYKAIVARDGKQAIEIYGQRHNEIDMAIIDLSMPGLDGRQTLANLKKIDSNLAVLLSSGHYKENEVDIDSNSMADGFLIKPYRVDQLADLVQKVFNGPRSTTRQLPA